LTAFRWILAAGVSDKVPNLVKKVVFPLELPLVPVCSTFVESSLGLMVLILLVGDNAGSSWYAVAVAAGLGAAVTANGRLGYSAAGFTVFHGCRRWRFW